MPEDHHELEKTISAGLIKDFSQSKFTQLAKFELVLDKLSGESNPDAIEYLNRYRIGKTYNRPDLVVSAATVEMARRYEASAEKSMQEFRDFFEIAGSDNRVSIDAKIETSYHFLNVLLAQTNSDELEIEGVLSELKLLLLHPDLAKRRQEENAQVHLLPNDRPSQV